MATLAANGFRISGAESSGVMPQRSTTKAVSTLESKVNNLLSRVERLEKSVSAIPVSGSRVGVSSSAGSVSPSYITSVVSGMDGNLLPTHNHSVLVAPGTSNAMFTVDGEGGFIFMVGTMRLKVVITATSRTWYAWNTSTNDWSEIGDIFDISI